MDAVDEVLDCRGMSCPLPILKLSGRARARGRQGVLEILGDDPALAGDLRAWASANGHGLVFLDEAPEGCRARVSLQPRKVL